MKRIRIGKGLDLPIGGRPAAEITDGQPVTQVAVLGDDYIDMKPTMLVADGDRVRRGQALFTDKKNEGVTFTAPGCGEVVAINRGAKRRFESLVIRLDGDDPVSFCEPGTDPDRVEPDELRNLLVESGLWCALRTRPYGKVPPIDSSPASLFVTAIDSQPLGPNLDLIIDLHKEDFLAGLNALKTVAQAPVYCCLAAGQTALGDGPDGIELVEFDGPHPAGLASTHIHVLDPVDENRSVWHLGAQDVIAVGALLRTGTLMVDRIVSLAGPPVSNPRHVRTRLGASISELCAGETDTDAVRLISGSVLDGRQVDDTTGYLGRYHQQISGLAEGTGRQLFGWLRLGGDRFTASRAYLSAFFRGRTIPFSTAVYGGDRAIYPLGTYEKVMPIDTVPIYLLKSIASGNTEKAKQLGCLELIEEDLALCTYVDPGKNDFGPMLRATLRSIEEEG